MLRKIPNILTIGRIIIVPFFVLASIDPDAAAARATTAGWHVLQAPANKPHALRETFLLDLEGYCWVPGVVIP